MADTVTFRTQCIFCHKVHTIEVDTLLFSRWRDGGEHIQNVWPNATPEEREVMISGTCPDCWDTYMKDPEEDEE